MHLSYRGIVYQPSFDGHSKDARRPECHSGELSVDKFLQKIVSVALSRIFSPSEKSEVVSLAASRNRSFGSVHPHMSLRTCEQGEVVAQEQRMESEFEQRLYRMERSLQLAYAIGDRSRVKKLEAEIETVTGWRFKRERTWLKR